MTPARVLHIGALGIVLMATVETGAETTVQYTSSSDLLGTNLRFRWEYQPGSELFVVYNDQRDTVTRGYPELENRALVIKINRLFRF